MDLLRIFPISGRLQVSGNCCHRFPHQSMPSQAPRFRPPYLDTGPAQPRPSRARFYGRRWQKLRLWYLNHHPLCECGCGRAATVVDHRRPHLGDPALIYDPANLKAMSKPCHDAKTAAQDGGFGNPIRNPLMVR